MNRNWTSRSLTLIILFLGGAVLLSFTQQDPVQNIISQYQTYLEQLPQEKIYIHSDRATYSHGETIWFKSYLVAGPDHVKSPLSRTIYVELINERNEVVCQVKQLVLEGWASGNIEITEDILSGAYMLRAYTNWMRNFDDAYFFYKGITICGPTPGASSNTEETRMDTRFFPEGGDLVEGLTSRVGFKSIGTDGLGRQVRGKVVDDQNNVVVSFQSNPLGMGSFLFTPEPGKKYMALLEGSSEQIPMPTPRVKGLILAVTNVPLQKHISIRVESNFSPDGQSFYLIGQNGGVVNFSAPIHLNSKVISTKIEKAELPEGITQITLFDGDGQPIAERLIYIEKEQPPLAIEVELEKSVFRPREEISLKIKTKDRENKPVAAGLSLAVTDDQQIVHRKDAQTIYSYLFLTSDLQGYIESPGYYFNPAHADRHLALDWLLMTQGWRRFVPVPLSRQDVKLPKPVYDVEQGLTLKGKVVNMYNMKPLPNGKVTYLAFTPMFDHRKIKASETGYFELKNVMYFDSSKVVLQGESRRGYKMTKIVVDSIINYPNALFSKYPLERAPCLNLFIRESLVGIRSGDAFRNTEGTILLDEVQIVEKKEDVHETFRMFGNAERTVKVSERDAIGKRHPLELVRGVAGVMINQTGMGWSVRIRGIGSINSGTAPLILVDNLEVPLATLNSIPAKDIESFDVWKGPQAAIFGSQGANGAIAFYTRKGVSGSGPDRGVLNLKTGGYQLEKEFYSPAYDVNPEDHQYLDNRATLFWNPNIQTDSTGVATIKFYNHDRITTLTGVIEGTSGDGKVGTSTFRYEIRKTE